MFRTTKHICIATGGIMIIGLIVTGYMVFAGAAIAEDMVG